MYTPHIFYSLPLPLFQLPVLIHELMVIEIWREKVYPLMLEQCKAPTSSFLTYIVVSKHLRIFNTENYSDMDTFGTEKVS